MTMYRICLRYSLLLIIAVIRFERRKAFCQAPGRRQNYESSNSEHGRKKSGFLGPKLSKKEHYFRPEKKLKDTDVGDSFFRLAPKFERRLVRTSIVATIDLRSPPMLSVSVNDEFDVLTSKNKTSKCPPLYMALCLVVLVASGFKWSSCTPNLLNIVL